MLNMENKITFTFLIHAFVCSRFVKSLLFVGAGFLFIMWPLLIFGDSVPGMVIAFLWPMVFLLGFSICDFISKHKSKD